MSWETIETFRDHQPRKIPWGKFVLVAFLLFIILPAAKAGWKMMKASSSQTLPPGYREVFCAKLETRNYYNDDPPEIWIRLQEGCYHENITLPYAWASYSQIFVGPDDTYATVWCAGEDRPRSIRYKYMLDMGNTMDPPCHDRGEKTSHFSIEGKGMLILRRTAEHPPLPQSP